MPSLLLLTGTRSWWSGPRVALSLVYLILAVLSAFVCSVPWYSSYVVLNLTRVILVKELAATVCGVRLMMDRAGCLPDADGETEMGGREILIHAV